jgi:drug/metabolite transporter (DMT)-like permease
MTPAARQQRLRVLLAFAAVYFVWGSTYLFIKYAIESIPPFLLGASRFIPAGLILLALARWRGARLPSSGDVRLAILTGILMLGVGNGAVVWSELTVPSGIVALIVSTVPIHIVWLDWLRPAGVRPGALVVLGLAMGLIGMVVLIGPRAIVGEGNVHELGALVLLAGSVSWAFGSILTRGKSPAASPLVFSALQMLAAGAAMLITSMGLGEPARFSWSALTLKSALSWVFLVLAGSVVAYTAYVYLLQTVSAAKAATYAYVNPVIAVLLGWAFAGEPIGPRTVLAAAIILAGVALITTRGAAHGHPTGEHPVPVTEGALASQPRRTAA